MPYQRSLEIEQRLDAVLRLIRSGKYSTPRLAQKVAVSIPTISRTVAALRERGHDIRAERHDGSWRYVVVENRPSNSRRNRVNMARGMGRAREHHDD